MGSNPLLELRATGQSVWFDYVGRDILRDGTLRTLIERDGVAGVTSNPSIFRKALAHWDEYERDFLALARHSRDAREIFYDLALDDVRAALDLLRPTYDRTGGRDGFVSFQLEPRYAHDAAGQVREARRLFERIAQPNLMIKVYGTAEGAEAVEELVAAGVNVNITLLFAVPMYERVAGAYVAGLERRRQAAQPLAGIASVASFFVSRVDTAVDESLPSDSPLRGRAAVANTQAAYDAFRGIFSGERWKRLAAAGAKVQRPLWASTGTKDDRYSDIKYVEELVAADTINTMPLETLKAFREHGRVRPMAITERRAESREALGELAARGVDLETVAADLVDDGIDRFAADFESVLDDLTDKLRRVA